MSSIAMVFNGGVGKVTTQTEEIMNFIQPLNVSKYIANQIIAKDKVETYR